MKKILAVLVLSLVSQLAYAEVQLPFSELNSRLKQIYPDLTNQNEIWIKGGSCKVGIFNDQDQVNVRIYRLNDDVNEVSPLAIWGEFRSNGNVIVTVQNGSVSAKVEGWATTGGDNQYFFKRQLDASSNSITISEQGFFNPRSITCRL